MQWLLPLDCCLACESAVVQATMLFHRFCTCHSEVNDTRLQGLAELHHHLWRCFHGDLDAFDTHLCEAAEAVHAGDALSTDAFTFTYHQVLTKDVSLQFHAEMCRCLRAYQLVAFACRGCAAQRPT